MPAPQYIHLTPVNLSSAKLFYDAKNPRNTSTLWEYALRIGSSFMVVSVSGIRRKMEMAVEKCVREDPEYWDMLCNTG